MSVSFESLLPEILPMLPNCSEPLAVQHIRSAAIQVCEETYCWQQDLDPVTTVAGTYEYDLEAPRNTAVHEIIWASFMGEDLEPCTTKLLETRMPRWRSELDTPRHWVKVRPETFWLAPAPNKTQSGALTLRVALKPSRTASTADEVVLNDHRDLVVNGALFRLMRIPSKDWSDARAAQQYGALFLNDLENARLRAMHMNTGVARSIKYGGIGVRKRRPYYARR